MYLILFLKVIGGFKGGDLEKAQNGGHLTVTLKSYTLNPNTNHIPEINVSGQSQNTRKHLISESEEP